MCGECGSKCSMVDPEDVKYEVILYMTGFNPRKFKSIKEANDNAEGCLSKNR